MNKNAKKIICKYAGHSNDSFKFVTRDNEAYYFPVKDFAYSEKNNVAVFLLSNRMVIFSITGEVEITCTKTSQSSFLAKIEHSTNVYKIIDLVEC